MKKIPVRFRQMGDVCEYILKGDMSSKECKLTKRQKEVLSNIIKKETNRLIRHFRTLSYPLTSDVIVEDILYEFFGIHISELIHAEVTSRCGVIYDFSWNDKACYRNIKEKVFYNPIEDAVYVANQAKDVNSDIQLGNL